MSVSGTVRQAGPFVGDALTTVFPFAFKCFAKSDLVATLTVIASGAQSTLVLDSDYTVALNADQDATPGGSITYTPGGSAMPATNNLTITSSVPQTQTVTLTIGGGFFPTVISTALDRCVILIQELSLRFTRGLSVAIGDTAPGALPNAVARALKFLAFDASGNPIASAGGASSPVSAAMAPVVAAATLGAAQTAMGVPASASGTHTGTTNISQALVLAGVITPAQITANQNDYAPANFATASMLRLDADAARSITGLAGGVAGRLIALRNKGAFAITLKDEDGGSTAANRFALSADYVIAVDQSVLLEYDATSSRWMLYGQQTSAATVLRSYLAGLGMSTAGGSGTMSVAAGQAVDSTNAALMSIAAFSKTTAAFAAGTGNGGIDTGAIANNTWYHFYLIDTAAGGAADITFSTNATTPTLNGAYVGGKYRRIGSGKTNGSAQWIAFTQDGDYFRWSASVLDVNTTNPGTSAVTATLASVPTGINVHALFNFFNTMGTSSNYALYLSDLAASDEAPSITATPFLMLRAGSSVVGAGGTFQIRTNTSAQIRYRIDTSGASDVIKISTLGWIDRRGRDA